MDIRMKSHRLFGCRSTTHPLLNKIIRQPMSELHTSVVPTKSFNYDAIVAATDNFSRAKSISRGVFSKIYRAKLLKTQVAVKKFAENNESGFLSEVLAISRTNHSNIVKMTGYCIHESTRLLVLEFVPNNTLDFHLYGGKATTIRWENRMKIALGVAKGLAYLHEDCDPVIIHRNIKPCNVFLDFDFEPKIAGFDFAVNAKKFVKSHTTTHPWGTGYMFPDYSLDNKRLEESDVSSFGLILLGLITGTKPSSYVSEAKRILPSLKKALIKKKYDAIADPALGNQYVEGEMGKLISCAASCIYKAEKSRPKMKQIVEALEGKISMEDIWHNKKDWRYLRPLEVDTPLEQICDELDHDIKVVVQSGIIENWLENDNVAVTVFNNLGKGNGTDVDDFSYARVIEDLNAYYRIERHKWKATLKQNGIVDPTSENHYVEEEMGLMVRCATSCLHESDNID